MAISATDLREEVEDGPIDMSVRLWSDDIPLKSLLDEAGLRAEHLVMPDSPLVMMSQTEGRRAERHYASLAHVQGRDDRDVESWLASVLSSFESGKALVENLRNGEFEGVVWVAVMADGKTPLPHIGPDLVEGCKKHGLKVLLESYNEADENGAPLTHWLTEPQAPGAPFRRRKSDIHP